MELLIIPSEERVEGVKKMKAWVVLAIMSLLTAGLTTPALAAKPANPNCWGVVTSQRATTVGDIGEHASSRAVKGEGLRLTPGAGRGNSKPRMEGPKRIAPPPVRADAGQASSCMHQVVGTDWQT